MLEPANRNTPGARKLVLGFDAGCAACSDLAGRISEKVGNKIEVRSLHHAQVEHWREWALGKDARWAPTLFEVGGAREVRAWTGPRMAVRLTLALGPVSTWRVMRVLGEVGVSSSLAKGMSRGQFLKNIAGGVLGIGVVSASGGLASPALAVQYEVNEKGLFQAFSMIERIPASVMARGDEAAREWLRAELQAELQSRGIYECSKSILYAIISNSIPVTKIRAAIRAFGGAFRLARFVVRRYRLYRSPGFGYDRWSAIRAVAKAVAFQTKKTTGEKVFDAFLLLFDLRGVKDNCF